MAELRIRGLSADAHRTLKVAAAENDISLNDLVRESLETLAKSKEQLRRRAWKE
jgi:predicted HicB family RNase H-like nuclease